MSTPKLNFTAAIFSAIVLTIHIFTQPFSTVTVVLWICYLASMLVYFLSRREARKEKQSPIGDLGYRVTGKDENGKPFVFWIDGQVYSNKQR